MIRNNDEHRDALYSPTSKYHFAEGDLITLELTRIKPPADATKKGPEIIYVDLQLAINTFLKGGKQICVNLQDLSSKDRYFFPGIHFVTVSKNELMDIRYVAFQSSVDHSFVHYKSNLYSFSPSVEYNVLNNLMNKAIVW